MNFRSYFHFEWIPERERERERECKRETETQSTPFARPSSSRRRSHVQAPVGAVRKHQPSIAIRDRELAFALIAIGAVLREITIDASQDRAVDHNLAFAPIAIDASRDHAVDHDLAFAPIAIDASRDRVVDRDLAKWRGASRSTARSSDWSSRSTASSNPVDCERQSGCCVCFSDFVFFLVAFSKH